MKHAINKLKALIGIIALGLHDLLTPPKLIGFANTYDEAVEVHAGPRSYKTDDTVSARHLLFKEGSDANHIALCGAAYFPLGTVDNKTLVAEDPCTLLPLGYGVTRKMVASEAMTVGDDVYTAANGKVQDEPGSAGTYYKVGRALTAAGADGDVIEVETCYPIPVVVVAAFTSTNGTAAGAADLAALKTEAEKIGDDVRALGAALASPALVKVLAA